MAEIRDISASVKYLAGYISNGEKFVRSWCSQGWVFPSWIATTRKYKRDFGQYPSREDLVALSVIKRAVREGEMDFLLETGSLSGDVLWGEGHEDHQRGMTIGRAESLGLTGKWCGERVMRSLGWAKGTCVCVL
jgi:hypothetical protein